MTTALCFVLAAFAVLVVSLLIAVCRALSAEEQEEAQETPAAVLARLDWVPGQRLDTEQLLISPDQRAWEVDELRALWAASPNENPRTHLPADQQPGETP